MKQTTQAVDAISGSPEVCVFIQGNPVAQGRGRIVKCGPHARIADPKKSKDWKGYVKHCLATVAPATPWDCPVMMSLNFTFHRPKARKRDTWVCTRPDLDNLAKGIMDASQGLIMVEDKQVCYLVAQKSYTSAKSPAPGVYVRFLQLIGGDE